MNKPFVIMCKVHELKEKMEQVKKSIEDTLRSSEESDFIKKRL